MRNFLFAFILLLSTFGSFTSCNLNCVEGSGPIITKTLAIGNFSELELNSSIPVFISQGGEQQVTVKGNENLIELLNKKLSGKTWEIEFEKCVSSTENFEVHITVTDLNRVELNGSGSITGRSPIKGEILELVLDGSGDLKMELQVKELETELNGSGDLQLSGSTKTHEISLDGSGDIHAENLKSDDVKIDLNGSGDVWVFSSYKLDIKVNGSGDVYYKGNVKSISSDIDGSGNLHQLND